MLAKVLAQELGPDGIRVNTVSPGMVQTGMTAAVYADQQVAAERAALVPLGRVATPEDIADVSRSCSARTRATSTATIWWSTARSQATTSAGFRAHPHHPQLAPAGGYPLIALLWARARKSATTAFASR